MARVTTTTEAAGTPGSTSPAVELAPSTATTDAPATAAVQVTTPPPTGPGLLGRARAEGVTGPAVVLLSTLLVACGAAIDLRRGGSAGLGTDAAFLLAALAAPAVVRFRSLPTAAVLPPLLFVGAAVALARLSGQNRGSREMGLDVATTLALSAPLLFAGTAAALVVVIVRVCRHLARR